MSRRISLRGISKSYRAASGPVKVLDGIDLEVGEAEILVLLGASGCGKTTLLRCLAGLDVPDTGEIVIGDETMYSSSRRTFIQPHARQVGMVFQSYAIWPHMTVFQNVAFPLRRQHVDRQAVRARVNESLAQVGCLELAGRYGRELSGGQQQRVAVARAIVAKPSVLLLDEPLSNLDAGLRTRLRLELSSLARRLRLTMVYVTHDQAEALTIADRIAVMEHGRVAQVGSPREIYRQPTSAGVGRALGTMNSRFGQVLGRDDQTLTVRCDLGVLRGQPGNSETESSCAAGDTVEICFRPQDAQFSAGSVHEWNRVSGAVEQVAFAGDLTTYVIRANGGAFDVLAPGTELGPERGVEVEVLIPVDALRIYRRIGDPSDARAAPDAGPGGGVIPEYSRG